MKNIRSKDYIEHAGRRLPWLTLGEVVRQQAESLGDAPFATFDDERILSFADLDRLSNRLANGLRAEGVDKGDRVASLVQDSPEQVIVFFATAKIGAVSVPINISLMSTDLHHVLAAVAPKATVIGSDLADVYFEARAALVDEREAPPRLEIVANERMDGSLPFFWDFVDSHDDGVPASPQMDPSDTACVLFSGGSTGLPKGVRRTHFSYVCAATRYGEIFRPNERDRHFGAFRLFHTGGQDLDLLGPLMHGIPTRINKWFSVSHFWEDVKRFGGTLTGFVGAQLEMLRHAEPKSSDADNPLRLALAATQGVSLSNVAQFEERFGIEILEVYGMTETGSGIFSNQTGDKRPGSVGHSRGWCDFSIMDERGVPQEAGRQGEICLRPVYPASMSLGYEVESDNTIESRRNLWIHTGDIGSVDEDGWLYYKGRQAHWMRRRGENVSSVEVETVINALESVVECAVVGVPSELSEDDIMAVVVLTEPEVLSAKEIVNWCRERLAYFKVPRYICFAESLPRSVTKNEIERYKLREMGAADAWDAEAGESGTVSDEARAL